MGTESKKGVIGEKKMKEEEEECEKRLIGTLRYVKALSHQLRREEVKGLDRDMVVLLSQLKRRG